MKPPKGGETQKRSRYITRRKCGVPSIFAFGKNLDAGRIHSARADKINPVSKKMTTPFGVVIFLVPVVGLEPTRCRHQRILSPSRLPIPSYRHVTLDIIPHFCLLGKLFFPVLPVNTPPLPRRQSRLPAGPGGGFISCVLRDCLVRPLSARDDPWA